MARIVGANETDKKKEFLMLQIPSVCVKKIKKIIWISNIKSQFFWGGLVEFHKKMSYLELIMFSFILADRDMEDGPGAVAISAVCLLQSQLLEIVVG